MPLPCSSGPLSRSCSVAQSCAVNEATGEIRHLEMPALAAIADCAASPLSPEEVRRRLAQPGRPLSEIVANLEGDLAMSKPQVPWTQDAETELTRIYTDNPEQRFQITAAATRLIANCQARPLAGSSPSKPVPTARRRDSSHRWA